MTSQIVVDARIAVKWIVPEEDSEIADAVAIAWDSDGVELVAPPLFLGEIANAVHRRVKRGDFSLDDGVTAFGRILSYGVLLLDTSHLWPRAMELATSQQQGAIYDCHYLALAEHLDCELWTADGKFYRATNGQHGRVRWLGEIEP